MYCCPVKTWERIFRAHYPFLQREKKGAISKKTSQKVRVVTVHFAAIY